MTAIFYENMSDNRYVTKHLNEIMTAEVVFLEDNNVVSPYIIIDMVENYNDINYCYISQLGRYYYVEEYTVLIGNRLKVNLKVDVLMSFADDIKTASALISRSNSAGNILVRDKLQEMRADDILTNLALGGCEFLRGINTTNYSFLLSTFGGVNSGN